MSFIGNNHLFTLTIIPDNGYDVKSGKINSHLIVFLFSFILAVFFICLFFIIGFHIKTYQEKHFDNELSSFGRHIKVIKNQGRRLDALDEKIRSIQKIDKALRLYGYMPVPDSDMYKAGVGGHVIVDTEQFEGIDDELKVLLNRLTIYQHSLDRQLFVTMNSLKSVRRGLLMQQDEINYTPSRLPTYSLQITSGFGMRRNPVTGARQFHDAVDFGGKLGDQIFSTAHGTVITVDHHEYRGRYIEIQHKFGYTTLYAHLDKIFVEVG